MTDLTILMDTKLGRPADMLEAAIDKGVQIHAVCLFPRLGGRVAHVAVAPEDVEKVRQIVVEHGGTVADERDAVVVPADFPGGARAIARTVASAGITVNVFYFGVNGEHVLATTDPEGTRQALGLS